jgi:Flp pilus assembly pilin Flp
MEFVKRFWMEEQGQDLVEYALLLGGLALACVAMVQALVTDFSTTYKKIGDKVQALPPT